MMSLQAGVACLILCQIIPGVSCYDYNISGLVVSSLVAFFLIMPIIAMLFVIVQWNDWYERKMKRDGRVKLPRQEWYIFPQREKRSRTVASTPKSERKAMRMQNNIHHYVPGSRHTSLGRQEYPGAMPWVGPPPPPAPVTKFEEKTQTMQFEPEEETVMVADLLPDPQQGQMRATQYRQTQVQNQTTYGGAQTNSFQIREQTDPQGPTMYVTLNDTQQQHVRPPSPTRVVQSKPYHVQLKSETNDGFRMEPANDMGYTLSQTGGAPSMAQPHVTRLSQTVIQPEPATQQVSWLSQTAVPSTSTSQAPRLSTTMVSTSGQGAGYVSTYETRQSPVEEGTAVFSFDAENESEPRSPINQAEDVVLF